MRVDIRKDSEAVFLIPYADGKKTDCAVAADEKTGTVTTYIREDGKIKLFENPETGEPETRTETKKYESVVIYLLGSTSDRMRHKLRKHFGKRLKVEPKPE